MSTGQIVEKQREYFNSGETLNIKFRKKQLKLLKEIIINNEDKIYKALKEDLGKSEVESYMCEVALVISEIDFMLKNLTKLAKPKKTKATIGNFPGKAYLKPCPKGVVLIMSPWNYPFMLTLEPLIDALAAGNTAIVKPSAYSKATSNLISELLSSVFDEKYVKVVMGGREVNQDLLTYKYDHIFFTGGKNVGKLVLEHANKTITPVTLELGGKSPCIIDKSACILSTAKRIVFGKFINAGQTCVAPDYILVHEDIKEDVINALIKEIKDQYGENPIENETYGKLINEKHFNKAKELLSGQKIIYGGRSDSEKVKIEPTIVVDPDLNSKIMTEEIFAPILPIISYKTKEEALEIVKRNNTPLACYIFTKNKDVKNYFLNSILFGGGCINDTIMHIIAPTLPFGGFGNSGMGAYHGKRGFETFSHTKTIVEKKGGFDLPIRFRPYTKFKTKIIKKFF